MLIIAAVIIVLAAVILCIISVFWIMTVFPM